MRKLAASIFACLALAALHPSLGIAETWYIKSDGTGDAPTIQAGVDSAQAGDSVLVAPGLYTGVNPAPSGTALVVMKSGVTVLSEMGAAATILDAEQNGRVFYISGVDETATIKGFTMLGGELGARVAGDRASGQKAVIHSGAGLWIFQGSALTITESIIQDNHADGPGGAMHIQASSPTISHCTFVGNSTGANGGAIYIVPSASPVIDHCTIVENTADGSGAGIFVGSDCFPLISHTIISGNLIAEGIACGGGTPTLTCCDIFDNEGGDALCGDDGGGNISLDPLFCMDQNPEAPYSLESGSPCLGGACGLIGAWPVGCPTTGAGEPGARLDLAPRGRPNPFADHVTIVWTRKAPGAAGMRIIDLSGRTVREISTGGDAGRVEVIWDGRDGAGNVLPSGVYFLETTGSGPRRVGRLLKL